MRKREDLERILAEQKRWAENNGREGRRAHLSGAILDNAVLTGANLDHADLSKASLQNAVLKGADLTRANLSGAHLEKADLTNATLSGGELGVEGADLTKAILTSAHLEGADFTDADLSGADLNGAYLEGTDLESANLKLAIYQPTNYTEAFQISSAGNLADLTYTNNPQPLVDLRNSFRDAGFEQPRREVNEAFRRHDPNTRPSFTPNAGENRNQELPHWLENVLHWRQVVLYWYQMVMFWLDEVLEWLQQVMFDWTCGWGAHPGRPLVIIGVIAILCTPVYWIGMHFKLKKGGLFLVATGERIAASGGKVRVLRIIVSHAWLVRMIEQSPRESGPKAWAGAIWRARKKGLRLEYKALRTAILFSLISVLNIGFEDFNPGLWIRMLQPREFDLRARGWMRTMSGLQSLLGAGLLALSILTYFGHPFE